MRHKILQLAIVLLGFSLVWGTGAHAVAKDAFHPFVALEPPVVVNLANPRRAQYLQLSIELQVDSPADAELINRHMPVIRDTLIMFYGGREVEEVRPVERREALRDEALEALRAAMREHTGRPAIEGLYFTGFLIQ